MSQRRPPIVWPPRIIPAALLLLACADSPTIPDLRGYSVEPTHQWAGGQIVVTALEGTFSPGDVIVYESDTLAIMERETDRIGLAVPWDANGPTTISIQRYGRLLGKVELETYGFVGTRTYPERLVDQITELPGDGAPAVVGSVWPDQDPNGAFVWIHPSSGGHRLFRGRPDQGRLFHIGVDPVNGDVFYDWRYSCSSPSYCGTNVHVGQIVGGDLRDRGWIPRPCHWWGCYPLAGDIWIVPGWGYTCRVVPTTEGETCVEIAGRQYLNLPAGIERLWSGDAGLVLNPVLAVFRLSTGERAYTANSPPVFQEFSATSAAADERRGHFYISARTLDSEPESLRLEIVKLAGSGGDLEPAFELMLRCPEEAIPPPRCGEPHLGFDPQRDVLFVVRPDTWTVEVRDAATTAVIGNIAMVEHPDTWEYARVVLDEVLDRGFIVFSEATRYDPVVDGFRPIPGTPVVEIRLLP